MKGEQRVQNSYSLLDTGYVFTDAFLIWGCKYSYSDV